MRAVPETGMLMPPGTPGSVMVPFRRGTVPSQHVPAPCRSRPEARGAELEDVSSEGGPLERGWAAGHNPRMDVTEAAVEILKSIRDELRRANERLDARLGELRAELRSTNERLGATNERLERLERRQGESEGRLATELTGVTHAVHELRDALTNRLDLRDDVAALARRVGELERRPQ